MNNALNLENMYTLFLVVLFIITAVLLGAALENYRKVQHWMQQAVKSLRKRKVMRYRAR